MIRRDDIPLIDIAPGRTGDPLARAALAAAVGEACATVGFLVVVGHGIDPALAEQAGASARSFFDRPLAEKMRSRPPPGIMRGYAPMGGESVTASIGGSAPPDLNESFAIGALAPPDDAYF